MIPFLPDPLEPMLASLRAVDGLDQVERVRVGAHILATSPRPPIGQSPYEVVHRHDKLTVRYYAPKVRAVRTPVVLVPSLINSSAILDLEPGRSLVGALAAFGHPTYLVDWGVPADEDAREDVGYVLLDLLHRSIDRVCRHAGTDDAAVFGYCMGGTIAAMLAALRPARVRALATLAAPVSFVHGGRFRDLVAPESFDVASIRDDALLPVEVIRPAFKLLDPMGNWSKHLAIEAARHDPDRLRSVLARERWLEENVPLQGAFAREFIRNAYQEDRLLDGTWTIRGETVQLASIRCPLQVTVCRNDFIAPAASTTPLARATSSKDVELVELDTGHIGVVVGSAGPKHFYPQLDRWLRRVGEAT